jgi:acetylornithine deacetylase/succinyl-diaminopimelate desuccinylase-like protein
MEHGFAGTVAARLKREENPMKKIEIDRDGLVNLALDLCNIESPAGQEGEVGEFVFQWMKREGFTPRKIGMFPDRFNVLGRMAGSGGGYSLIFNSHLDTGRSKEDRWSIRNPDDEINHSAWLKDDTLYGEGVVNDKGPMAAFMMAAKALKTAGITLRGDLLLSAVPGEIGYEAVDEFQAPTYLSKEVGTRYLIQHGGVADYALVAEGTDFDYAAIEAGKAFFKISIFGDNQLYTPFVPGGGARRETSQRNRARISARPETSGVGERIRETFHVPVRTRHDRP